MAVSSPIPCTLQASHSESPTLMVDLPSEAAFRPIQFACLLLSERSETPPPSSIESPVQISVEYGGQTREALVPLSTALHLYTVAQRALPDAFTYIPSIVRTASEVLDNLQSVPNLYIHGLDERISRQDILKVLLFIQNYGIEITEGEGWQENPETGRAVKRMKSSTYGPDILPHTLLCIREEDGTIRHTILFNREQDDAGLGKGGNNKVKLGYIIEEGRFVGVRTTKHPNGIAQARNEVSLLLSLPGAHVAKPIVYETSISHKEDHREKFTTVTDLAFCDLSTALWDTVLPEVVQDEIARRLIEGVHDTHADPRGVMHQDLKKENIFISLAPGKHDFKDASVTIADFEFAAVKGQTEGLERGSPLMVHPYLTGVHSQARDTWALGLMLWELWDITLIRTNGTSLKSSEYEDMLCGLLDRTYVEYLDIDTYIRLLRQEIPKEGWLQEPPAGTREHIVWSLLKTEGAITAAEALDSLNALAPRE